MPDFEAPDADALEQEQSAGDAEAAVEEPAEVDLEAPEADAVEQSRAVAGARPPVRRELPAEADEADAADQALEVELDEDEYR